MNIKQTIEINLDERKSLWGLLRTFIILLIYGKVAIVFTDTVFEIELAEKLVAQLQTKLADLTEYEYDKS